MADEQVTPPIVTQGNETAARTETGEIKDQQSTQTVTTPETKTEAKSESTETKAEAKPDTAVVPDKYEFKAPEGFEPDAKFLEDVTPVLKELNLTQDQANKLFDIYTKHSLESAEAPYKQYETMRTDWRNEIVKNPALGDGKEGLRPEAKANIANAISAVGDAKAQTALKEALDLTGAGDNPAIVSAFATLGKLLSEGTAVKAGAPAPVKAPNAGPRNAAQALYPSLPSSANS